MKKIASLLLAVLMLCAVIPFAAIPAAAEQTSDIVINGNAAYSDKTYDMSGEKVKHIFVINGSGTVTFSNITFMNVTGSENGSCVFIDGDKLSVTFINCRFISCSAEYGGAVYIEDVDKDSEIRFIDCHACDCHADGDGGFMYVNDADAVVYGSEITDRKAGDAGPDEHNTVITGCVAGDNGGAIYMNSGKLIDGFFLSDNAASDGDGGGICNKSNSATISSCRFYRNTASDGDGGGLYTEGSAVENCKFFDNECSDDGYELCSYFSSTKINNCTFTSSHTNESAAYGGTLNNCTFPEKSSYTLCTGDGSQENPYVINNIDDWDAMYYMVMNHYRTDFSDGRTMISEAADAFKDKFVRLDKNITVCNAIGKASYDVPLGLFSNVTYTTKSEFTGTFDGNEHTVTCFICDNNNGEKSVFGNANGATVKNLTVDGYISGTWSIGGIFGYAENCTAENCVNNAAINGSESYVGGIAGYSVHSFYKNCTNDGKIEGVHGQVGGIAGYSNGDTFNACKNNGDVYTEHQKIGGIAGQSTNSDFIYCVDNGVINGSQEQVGGIAGYAEGGSFDCCTNNGDVITGSQKAGGIVGKTGGTLSIKHCVNNATVTAPYSYGGGIIGYEDGKVTVQNCLNTGKVNAAAPARCYPAEGDYVIYSAYDNKYCFDIQGGANALEENGNLQLWTAQNSGAKVFTLKYSDKYGAYYIIAKHSGLALTAEPKNYSTVDLVNVYQFTGQGLRYQLWTFEPGNTGDSYKIRSVDSGFTMNVANGTAGEGVNLIAYKYGGNDSFNLVPEPDQVLNEVYANGITGKHFGGSTYENCYYDKEKAIGDRYGTGLSTDAIYGKETDPANGLKLPDALNDYVNRNAASGLYRIYFDELTESWQFILPDTATVLYYRTSKDNNRPLNWGGDRTRIYWIFVSGAYNILNINGRAEVTGDVRLVLLDNCKCTITGGIHVPDGSSLSIYSQNCAQYFQPLLDPYRSAHTYHLAMIPDENQIGKLNASADKGNAVIGGNAVLYYSDKAGYSGDVTVFGGNLDLTSKEAPCIGGGSCLVPDSRADGDRSHIPGNNGDIFIYDGYIKTTVEYSGSFNKVFGPGMAGLNIPDNKGTVYISPSLENVNGILQPKKSAEKPATGSVLSEGSRWIIGGVALFAVVCVAALVIVKKKKKSALADGAEKQDEE